MGATGFADLCQQIEALRGTGTVEQGRELAAQLAALLDKVAVFVEAEVAVPET